jgi:hypothetical protein
VSLGAGAPGYPKGDPTAQEKASNGAFCYQQCMPTHIGILNYTKRHNERASIHKAKPTKAPLARTPLKFLHQENQDLCVKAARLGQDRAGAQAKAAATYLSVEQFLPNSSTTANFIWCHLPNGKDGLQKSKGSHPSLLLG